MKANRGGSRTAATSKMERFVIIPNGFQPLTIITKRSILDVAAVPDPPLANEDKRQVLLSANENVHVNIGTAQIQNSSSEKL